MKGAMQKLATEDLERYQNIVLQGYDPLSAHGFTQVPNILFKSGDLSAWEIVCYSKLLSYAWNNNLCYPGQETMAKDLGTNQSTISRAIQALEQKGWLEIKRRGQGETNLYILKTTAKKTIKKTGKM